MVDKEVIGRRLRKLRGVFRTQQEVSDATGIDRSLLSRYESGQQVPPDETKVILAGYYGRTVQAIFFDPEVHEREQEAT